MDTNGSIIEVERALLGALLIAGARAGELSNRISPFEFTDHRHQHILQAIHRLAGEGSPIEVPILYTDILKRGWPGGKPRGEDAIAALGGLAYLIQLPEACPSLENWQYWENELHAGAQRRTAIRDLEAALVDMQTGDMDSAAVSDLLTTAAGRLTGGALAAPASMTPRQLFDFDTRTDPDALVGLNGDTSTTRYLCRGYGAWLIGPSGIGKSSLVYQHAASWAIGRDVFGIRPLRPLRCLIIQAENDRGDNSEMLKGVLSGLEIDPDFAGAEDFALLNENLSVITEGTTTQRAFCRMLEQELLRHRSDVVFVDPLLSFAGIEISRQDQCSRFLREWLNPVLKSTGACLIGAHHMGKPKDPKITRGWSILDYAYAGIGSSELVNWARAVSVVIQTGENDFVLKLAKRGPRAHARHPNGTPAHRDIFLRHAEGRIYWEQVDPPEEPPQEDGDGQPGGRPSKVDKLLGLGLGAVIDALDEPVGRNALARIIEDHAASKGMDVSQCTCRRAIEHLVETKALKKDQNGYRKPQI